MNNFALMFCAMSIAGGLAQATEAGKAMSPDKMMPIMTTEQRHKMADAHEKMAGCLRSDKPMMECHDEMMKSCHENMGKDGCPMDGHMKGMHHNQMSK